MADRKVINKFHPNDFNPSQRINFKRKNPKQKKVRMMMPMSAKCESCGQFIARGTKFNSRKEVTDDTYLGIAKYRFYNRCPACAAEFTIKTEPKTADYFVESGATRQAEPWKQKEDVLEEPSFEKQMRDCQRKQQTLVRLSQIKERNYRSEILQRKTMLTVAYEETELTQEEQLQLQLQLQQQQFTRDRVRRLKDSDCTAGRVKLEVPLGHQRKRPRAPVTKKRKPSRY